jgi:hypothetical protein
MQGHYELRHERYTSYLKSSDVDSMDTFRVQTENTNHNIILSTLYVALVTLNSESEYAARETVGRSQRRIERDQGTVGSDYDIVGKEVASEERQREEREERDEREKEQISNHA